MTIIPIHKRVGTLALLNDQTYCGKISDGRLPVTNKWAPVTCTDCKGLRDLGPKILDQELKKTAVESSFRENQQ